ncbi:MAG: hypothetical protein RJR37_13070 [Peptococcaceae bacterium MAG4]|nr:hypothetical protein [Peptococcaceae bacterium MAG4]NLW39128.1 hypothetical protein [Peptococcaceae bacterium]HQD76276.1 hypothetical protein [Bacillota bacterium]
MHYPHWLIFNKRTALPVLALVIIGLLLLWGGVRLIAGRGAKLPPLEMLMTGLEKTMVSSSFRYWAETKLISQGKANVDFFSQVEGERVAPDKVWIKGQMMNTPIEFIQVGDNSYFKNQATGKWIALPGNKLVDSELFYAELNPLAYFNFKDVPDIKYLGQEKVDGEKLLCLEMRPNLMDPFLELRLTGYTYKVWLNPGDYRLRRAIIQALDKHNPQSGVEINLRFWDYDQNMNIVPPV